MNNIEPTRHQAAPQQYRVAMFKLLASLGMALLAITAMTGNARAFALPDFETLVKQHGQAVVKISVSAEQKRTTAGPGSPQFDREQLPEFFRRYFENMPQDEVPGGSARPRSRPMGSGSGFILSSDGYIVTNAHVVDGGSEITVSLPDRRQFEATLVGADKRTDLALLKVNATGLPVLALGDSDSLNVGQWVLAIGSPFGFEYTATQGIVSALSRSLPDENYVPFIQTDVAVNPGNSGGPLFNTKGEVVGVNSQIFSRSGGYMGLSFAIPSNVVKTVVNQLRDTGYVSRGWLGVMIQGVDKTLADSFGLDRPQGALVARVTEDSPAYKAGIQAGDVILAFNGTAIARSSNLPPLVGATPIGEPVDVKVLRNREQLVIPVTIAELAEDRQVVAAAGALEQEDEGRLGVSVSALSSEQLAEYGVKNGVLVNSVDPDGVAAVAGIIKGDVLVTFDHKPVGSVGQLASLVKNAESGWSVAVLLQRGDTPLFTALTMP